jgi:hypothetical protein
LNEKQVIPGSAVHLADKVPKNNTFLFKLQLAPSDFFVKRRWIFGQRILPASLEFEFQEQTSKFDVV